MQNNLEFVNPNKLLLNERENAQLDVLISKVYNDKYNN